MKRMIAAVGAIVMAAGLTGCGKTEEIVMENDSTQLYTEEDLEFARDHILFVVELMETVPDRVAYLGDEYSANETVADTLNELCEDMFDPEDEIEYMGFEVDFHYPKSPDIVMAHIAGGDWSYITLKKAHHQIWFARTEGGEWEEVYVSDEAIKTSEE